MGEVAITSRGFRVFSHFKCLTPAFFEKFFTGLSYEQDFFWVQSGRWDTTSEAKMKFIGGLKTFLRGFEKKV